MKARTVTRWAIFKPTDPKKNVFGESGSIPWQENGDVNRPELFYYKKDCQAVIDQRYGYLKNRGRPDLRAAPHGWLMPRPIRVRVTIEAVGGAS